MVDNQPTELAYDLRQKYAQLVGDHLEDISISRRSKDYPEYFRGLENLFTIIKHKFKPKKTAKVLEVEYEDEEDIDEEKPRQVKKVSKEDKKSDLDRYKEIRGKVIEITNEFPTVFLGRTDNPEELVKVERALREMEMFLYYVMDKAKMFGSVGYNEGM